MLSGAFQPGVIESCTENELESVLASLPDDVTKRLAFQLSTLDDSCPDSDAEKEALVKSPVAQGPVSEGCAPLLEEDLATELKIVVSLISGECLDIVTPRGSTVADVKKQVESLWHVPVEFQQFSANGTIALDSIAISSLGSEESAAIDVLLCVSFPKDSDSEDKDLTRIVWKDALSRFTAVGQRGDRLAISFASACLQDNSDFQVRRLALQLLEKCGHTDNENICSMVIDCMEDSHEEVRRQAPITLKLLAPKGDRYIISRLLQLLEHPATNVRQSSVWALSEIAGGDKDVKEAVLASLAAH